MEAPKLFNDTERIKNLLIKYPHLRDDDFKLISNIWLADAKRQGLDPKKAPIFSFLQLLSEGKLSNAESIRRTRQKLQQEFPNTRGEAYYKRKKSSKEVVNQIFNTPELYPGGTP